MKVIDNQSIFLAVLAVASLLVFNMAVNPSQYAGITGWSTASGILKICINTPPVLAMTCDSSAVVNSPYTCDADASDTDGAIEGVSQTLVFSDDTSLFEIDPTTGVIQFTPTSAQAGNHTITIMVTDNSTCSNAMDSGTLTLSITKVVCGDGTCNGGESCSTCSQDCGQCPAEPSSPASSGAGGGGGGDSSKGFHIDYSRIDSKILRTKEKELLIISYDGITKAHQLRITEVNENSITALLKDELITFTLRIGEKKEFDTNDDGLIDFSVMLEDIQEKDIWLFFEKEEGFETIFKEKIKDFIKIKPQIVRISIKLGDSIEKPLIIENIGPMPIDLSVEIENLEDFLKLKENSFSIDSLQTKTFDVEYTVKEDSEPGVYSGRLVFKSEDIETEVPIILEAETRRLIFDAKVNIPSDYKQVLPGKEVPATIDVHNLEGIGIANVQMTYQIRDSKGDIIVSEEERIVIGTDATFMKMLSLPDSLESGKYVFVVTAKYGDSLGTATDVFEITSEELLSPAGYKSYVVPIMITLIISALAIGIFVYEERKRKLPRSYYKDKERKKMLTAKKQKLIKSIKDEMKHLKRRNVDVSDEESIIKKF